MTTIAPVYVSSDEPVDTSGSLTCDLAGPTPVSTAAYRDRDTIQVELVRR